jgi:hypothetical protein
MFTEKRYPHGIILTGWYNASLRNFEKLLHNKGR